MRVSRDSVVTLMTWLMVSTFIVLAIVGAARSFSGVPYWDSWTSYVDFYFKAQNHDWRIWWAQSNEHRIVLSRLLFWADMDWLRGGIWMLIAVNYLLVLGAFLTWRSIVREFAGPEQASSRQVKLLLAFIFICLFSWMQRDNFIWEFQSQFILAQWLPLLAMWFLYRSTSSDHGREAWFVAACLTGILSVGSMANGVLALPLMAAYALWLRMGWRKVLLLAALSSFCTLVYWVDLQDVGGHGGVSDAGHVDMWLLLRYVLLYLGAPFHHGFGKSMVVGQIFGAVLVLLAVRKALRFVRQPRQHALEWSLLFYLAYLGGTALVTAIGRAEQFGLFQATSNRYATPALMAWVALLVLHQPWVLRELQSWRRRMLWPLALLVLGLAAVQLKALRNVDEFVLERQIAALSMVLGVRDEQQINIVYFDVGRGIDIARRAAMAERSVYARPAFAQVMTVGQMAGSLPVDQCKVGILERAVVPKDPSYVRLRGWVAKPEGAKDPVAVRVVTADGMVAGYALVGKSGQATAHADGLPVGASVFRGYARADATNSVWRLDVLGAGCVGVLESMGLRVDPVNQLDATVSTVGVDRIVSSTGWDGADYQRSQVPGLRMRGTFVQSDTDTGSLSLTLRRGDRLAYRTGPVSTRLRYRIDDGQLGSGSLPLAESWGVLVFDDPALPETFGLTLSDEGDGWGEWMAVALKAAD